MKAISKVELLNKWCISTLVSSLTMLVNEVKPWLGFKPVNMEG